MNWKVMQEFGGGEFSPHQTVYRVYCKRCWIWWCVRTFVLRDEALDYAGTAWLADVPAKQVWP